MKKVDKIMEYVSNMNKLFRPLECASNNYEEGI